MNDPHGKGAVSEKAGRTGKMRVKNRCEPLWAATGLRKGQGASQGD